MRARLFWLVGCYVALAVVVACGNNGGGNSDSNTGPGFDDGGRMIDAGFGTDAPFGGMCTPGSAQCSNCVDDDADGKIDGFDAECSGPLDNDESSFKTGIPGDNIDDTMQDCFFDGNSGQGNDGCNQHTCCLLNAPDKATCHILAPEANENKYVMDECYPPVGTEPVPAKCTMVCGALTPPGCDCFGCCTICEGSYCAPIAINPALSPNCDATNIDDFGPDGQDNTGDEPCKRCVKNTMCGTTECGGASCVLCPGQDPSTLPSSCGGSNMCPMGYLPCDAGGNCAAGTYCSAGCCIGTIL